MANTKWSSEVRLTTDAGAAADPRAAERDTDLPFVITVLADCTGIAEAGSTAAAGLPSSRRLLTLDRDNFDTVLAGLHPTWVGELQGLPEGSGRLSVQLTFGELDDFHPDRIVERLEPLRLLLETRRALQDP